MRAVRVVAELGDDVSILLEGVFNPPSRICPALERGFDPGHFRAATAGPPQPAQRPKETDLL